jgi:hypothetical protein
MSSSDPPAPGSPGAQVPHHQQDGGRRPAKRGRLTVTAPGALISVLNSGYQPAADATSDLSVELPAGAYRATAHVGGTARSSLAVIRPGRDTSLELRVAFPAAAPVAGTTSANKSHQDLVREVTREVSQSPDGPPAALVLVLRDLSDKPLPPQPSDLTLFDGEMRVIQSAGWKRNPENDAAVWSKRLDPGGYVLRTKYAAGQGDLLATDQAVWLSPGWMTVVFMPTGPRGLRPVTASVQMVRMRSYWEPLEDQALASEAVLAGLRDGAAAVDDRQLRDMLHAKFVNPMFGVLGAQVLVQQLEATADQAVAHDRLGLLQAVVNNLVKLIGDHPDVAALTAAVRMAHGRAPGVSVTWPPMLAASLSQLIKAGQVDRATLPPRSPAERVTASRFMSGPWLLWHPTPDLAPEPQVHLSSSAGRSAEVTVFGPGQPAWYRAAARRQEPSRAGGGVRPGIAPLDDAARRCDLHLEEVSDLLGMPKWTVARELGPAELSRRLTMPVSLVEAAVRQLAAVGGWHIESFGVERMTWTWHKAAAEQASTKLRKQDPWGYGQLGRELELLTTDTGSPLGRPGSGRIRQMSADLGNSHWIVLFVERRDTHGLGGLVVQRSGRGQKELPKVAYETARQRLSEMPRW